MKKNIIAISIIGMLLSACSQNQTNYESSKGTGLNTNGKEKTVFIGAETKPCTGVIEMDCLQVKWSKDQKQWEHFYDRIEGFSYQEGYEYELIVRLYSIDNPPADASSVRYKLVKEVSKKQVKVASYEDEHSSRNALDWAGTYEGTFPCASCPGIKTTLLINEDLTYILTEEYLEEIGKPVVTKGKFTWNSNGNVITLTHGNGTIQYKVGENKLTQLNAEGEAVTGSLARFYVMQKQQNQADNSSFEDKNWKLVNFMGKSIKESERDYYIVFIASDKRMSTKVGCNVMNGSYMLSSNNKLSFREMMSTMMACPNGSIEDEYRSQLSKVDSYTVDGETLELKIGNQTIATYILV